MALGKFFLGLGGRLAGYGAAPVDARTPPTFAGDPVDDAGEYDPVYSSTGNPPGPIPRRLDSPTAPERFETTPERPLPLPRMDSPDSLAPPPPKRPDAREEYANIGPPPVMPKTSVKRQLAGAALQMLPVVNQTTIPGDVAHPGYRQQMQSYAAKSEDAKRRAAMEDQAEQRGLTREQRDIARRNEMRQEKRDQQQDEDRDLGKRIAVDEMYQKRGGAQVASNGMDLSPGSEQDYNVEQDPLGRTWQIPTAAKTARDKAEATGHEVVDVPLEMRAQLGDKATRDQITRAFKNAKEKQDDTYWLNKSVDPKATPQEKAQADAYLKRKAALAQSMKVTVNSAPAAPQPEPGTPQAAADDVKLRKMAAANPSLDKDAWDYMITGRLNVRGRSQQTVSQVAMIKARAGQIMNDFGMDPGELMARGADLKGATAAFSKISTYSAQIESFEETLLKNAELAKKLSAEYKRGNIQLLNRIQNAYKTGVGDSEALNMSAQLHGLAREWGKIMQGSVSAMGVPISEANATDALFSKGLANGQLDSLIEKVIKPDAQNRVNANNSEKAKLLARIRGVTGGGGQAGGAPSGPAKISTKEEYDKLPSGSEYIDAADGKRYKKR